MAPQAIQGAPATRTLLLFGPGAMTLDEQYFKRILSFAKDDAACQWALHAIEDVEQTWDSLRESIPKLQRTSGAQHAQALAGWLRTGLMAPETTVANTPNAILGPLVIIAQLTEYLRYVSSQSESGLENGRRRYVPQRQQTETIGCCLGVFSALVVSSSLSWAQFCHNAGAVLRVVFLLGALSDAQDAVDVAGPSFSLIAFWRGGQSLTDLKKALENYPEAYVSVLYDDNRVTVTTSTRTASALKTHLRTVGITANDTEFHGRFHAGRTYEDDLQALFRFYRRSPTFQLPDATSLVLPTRINSGTVTAGQESLLELASRAFLKEQFDWINAFRSAVSSSLRDRNSRIIEFGPERCVPPTLLRRLSSMVTHFDFASSISSNESGGHCLNERSPTVGEDEVAVIGMSCNVAGAEDLEEFWNILLEGKSQHQELVPNGRFVMETAFRPKEERDEQKWYGNLIRDYDAFDYKFFRRPPREVLHMDPQQRFMLQTAYQAVAQSGYYHNSRLDSRIGCYLGMVGSDYENNVSHTSPNAFSATGALRSYIAGKVSHFFGWTGPGMTVDTACSASTVAISLACQAILNGECSAALAGGTNFCNTPMFFQNLSAGSFLSHTGQCKPFDAKADGYCRGEGIGAVFLRRLKDAVADGDQILGVISATAINQNHNTTPIFVPNPPSLVNLFHTVLKKSGLDVKDISVVEAHGTGTPVGDPAEYGSIRNVLGGPARTGLKPLQIGSLKGLIGHTEGASGVLALIKILLMMQASKIPPQASFDSLSPAIKALPSDNMEITKTTIPWTDEHKAVLINNYGAAGSNASMIIKETPWLGQGNSRGDQTATAPSETSSSYPIYVSGLDDKAIRAHTTRLRQFITSGAFSESPLDIENVAFNINRQSNWSLARGFVFDAKSTEDLEQRLTNVETFAVPAVRPIILCFGGQISKFIGLDRKVFEKAAILRRYLDQCDSVCKEISAGSIYPGIFQREPISDPSVLQPLLFSIQYACAMSWIDSGASPAALIGHSFGELTALCVSGILSLEDAMKMVHGRSKIINETWGPEKGSMMAIEADLIDVENLLLASNAPLDENGSTGKVNIACFNSPRSFTLAGPVAAIDAVEEVISAREPTSPVFKYKRLDVTNAFHSTLVERLKGDLEILGRKLHFQKPSVQLERATKERETSSISASYVADHMRKPVYFDHAVQRLAAQYPEAIWLEAGSNSTITTMANKALRMPRVSMFQAVNVTSSNQALQQLVNTTLALWKAGLRASFWPHSRAQTYQYTPIILPPYQFEKHRQWLEFKPPQEHIVGEALPSEKAGVEKSKAIPTSLFTLLEDQARNDRKHRFSINTTTRQYLDVVSGHIVGKTAQTLPAAFVIDMAIEAIISVQPHLSRGQKLHPQIYNVRVYHPIFADSCRDEFLDFERHKSGDDVWTFKFVTKFGDGKETVHIDGQLHFQPYDDSRSDLEFSRLDRLVTYDRCLQALKSGDDAEDVIQGGTVYKVFADIVNVGDKFRGLQKLVGRATESAGKVLRRRSHETWLDSTLAGAFIQVGSIWINCLARHRYATTDTIYVGRSIEQWVKSPDVLRKLSEGSYDYDQQREWHILAQHKHLSREGCFISDFFIFDALSGDLEEVILGLRFLPVSLKQLLKDYDLPATGALTPTGYDTPRSSTTTTSSRLVLEETKIHQAELPSTITKPSTIIKNRKKHTIADLWIKLQTVLADISGLEPEEIKQTDSLAEIGIDSLMGMEMAREVETTFECSFEQSELLIIEDVPGILRLIQSTLGDQSGATDSETSETTSAETSALSSSTPSSVTEDIDSVGLDTNLEKIVDLPSSAILEAFRESNKWTDHQLKSHGCAGYLDGLSQKQTRLCLKLTSEAFKQLGCDLEAVRAGEVMQPVNSIGQHQRFLEYLYTMLEDTRIISIDEGVIKRSAIPLPTQHAETILEDLMRRHADNGPSHQLTYNIGSRMADVLSGKVDGPQLLFGDAKNRDLMADFYGELPFNKMCFEQISDFVTKLATKLKLAAQSHTTLKILEMGAGTGGMTKVLVPALAQLGLSLEYTFTDLSPSLVAQAKRKYARFPFMKFAVHDIEKAPSDPQLTGSQHIVIASNAVHATHSLKISAQNIHKFLRPDGFLMLLEMMEPLHWIDVVWGTLEGWWLFDDGRTHAIVDEKRWKRDLLEAGYKHVEWTDGKLIENRLQKVLIALAADVDPSFQSEVGDSAAHDDGHHISDEANRIRKLAADEYVTNMVQAFQIPESARFALDSHDSNKETCVIVTGTTGSLGSHILAHLVSLPAIKTVYCLNRQKPPIGGPKAKNGMKAADRDPLHRQIQALESRGIILDASMLEKIKVIETDSSKPQLGLEADQYGQLLITITHIIHNAFPVNGVRTLKQNEPQFDTMRNLIDFAAHVSAFRRSNADSQFKFTFQFVSSLSAVGKYPSRHGGRNRVPEEQFDIDSALPNGYGGAKVVCERILSDTLGRHRDRFQAMTVRLGQLSGSMKTGYWNSMEVLAFLFKSVQTLRSLPAMDGVLTWLPIEEASASLADLLLCDAPRCYPVYHLDNPIPRTWKDITPVLAEALDVPQKGIVPLDEWLRRIQMYPGEDPWDNPAVKAWDFFEHKFQHMSCGGVTMFTDRAREHSATMRAVQPVSDELIKKFMQAWKASGFLR